jgi:hypothetical protein
VTYDFWSDPVAVELAEDCKEEWGRNLELLQQLWYFPEDAEEEAEMMRDLTDEREYDKI